MSKENQENQQSEVKLSTPLKNNALELVFPKWLKIASLVSALFLTLLIGVLIRGSWAETVIKNPTDSSQGILRQLYQNPEGKKEVRSAAILDYPPDKVWGVITDYKHFQDIFGSRLWSMEVSAAEEDKDGKIHLTGKVNSKFGTWPIDVYITHNKTTEKYIASWNQPFGKVLTNRGNWTITPAEEGKSLIVYTLETEVDPFPTFFTNTVLLSQSKNIIKSVEQRLKATEK